MPEIPYIKDLRHAVDQADRRLDPTVFDQIQRVFIDYFRDEKVTPRELSGEYDLEEFLSVVDINGRPAGVEEEMLSKYRETKDAHSHFGRWFHEGVRTGEDQEGQPILLAARWLCHLIGLRHVTVEIFIDPPEREGFTLVQVRGMDKFEAPGTFDIPCAGHVSGVDTVMLSLIKELAEELNLRLEDLVHIHQIYQYNSSGKLTPDTQTINEEYRYLYRAQLLPSSLSRIRFIDGEVAGLGLISITELRELVRRFPERVASGLADAIGFYQ